VRANKTKIEDVTHAIVRQNEMVNWAQDLIPRSAAELTAQWEWTPRATPHYCDSRASTGHPTEWDKSNWGSLQRLLSTKNIY